MMYLNILGGDLRMNINQNENMKVLTEFSRTKSMPIFDYGISDFGEYEIEVEINNRVKVYSDVPVSIEDHGNFRKLVMAWSDIGIEDYKKRGLYEMYSTGYCVFSYENEVLAIETETAKLIIKD